MGWHHRSTSTFPAVYFNVLQKAAASPGEPQVLATAQTAQEIDRAAEHFRWFRWCGRQEPGSWLYELSLNYDIRASITTDEAGHLLFITIKPTKVSEFIRLNPELAASVLPDCQ